MALTDSKIRNLKPRDKTYRVADEKGLYLEVFPNSSKYWRHKYRFNGKEKRLAYGVYPEVTLKEARSKRDTSRKLLEHDTDPGAAKLAKKAAISEAAANSFQIVALEWYEKQKPTWATSTAKKRKALIDNDLIPWLGKRPVSDISAAEILTTLQRIENRGAKETAHNGRQVASQIFRYARLTQRCTHDPVQDLKGALSPKQTNHRPAITEPAELGKLLVAIDEYQGTHIVRSLLALCPLLFQRPGEMIAMEWQEIDLESGEWQLPADKMKMKTAHLVPLPQQAIAIIKDLHPLTGQSRYVFPNQSKRRTHHASNGTINKALQNIGIDTKTVHCAHGFRATARTILDEQLGFRAEWIEHQLAHQVRDTLGRAYNRTKHLPQRAEMMQKWADYLDTLKIETSQSNILVGNFSKEI
ncbi:tyrosine-type recombinase/integrase [Oceanicoccus sagamiensis]|uniref:Integrase n=1 Tax=Oceanicoccus sagamiensis TaxID=716816 RepID=A0A1X9NHZ7_9GAMM|nr:integrase arm-type DNA-binding domain-containing protein [Oceanicoccus sagamiensis]ARN73613.1 integrase [Oceanicoccus sagamiensis]